MAIKINVGVADQIALNQVLKRVGYLPTRRKFHCTIGFIDKIIPHEEVTLFGQAIVYALQALIEEVTPVYEVREAAHLFKHVIAFAPTPESEKRLKDINLWLWEKVREISVDGWGLNVQTLPENYKPHLTLGRTRRPDRRFKKLEEIAKTHPSYQLTQAGFVVFG